MGGNKMKNELNYNPVLDEPTNRAIFQAFWVNEFNRIKESVYTPLEKRYSSLKGIIEEFQNDYDPIARYEEDKFLMEMFAGVSKIAGLVNIIAKDKCSQRINRVMAKVDIILELYAKSAQVQETFYVSFIGAAKRVGRSNGVKPVELFENLDYSDEVQRESIPEKWIAKDLFAISQVYEASVFNAKRYHADLAKNRGLEPESVLEVAKLIPTAKAVNTLQAATREYKTRELNRIYGR